LPFKDLTVKSAADLRRIFDEGLILEDSERIITFRLKTFQALIDRLVSLSGSNIAKVLFHQLGNEVGQAGMRYSKDQIQSENDLGPVLDNVLKNRGWGTCLGIDVKKQNNKQIFVATMHNCPLCFGLKSSEPQCDFVRGIVSGWIEGYMARKASIDSTETECVATGGKNCIFEISYME